MCFRRLSEDLLARMQIVDKRQPISAASLQGSSLVNILALTALFYQSQSKLFYLDLLLNALNTTLFLPYAIDLRSVTYIIMSSFVWLPVNDREAETI